MIQIRAMRSARVMCASIGQPAADVKHSQVGKRRSNQNGGDDAHRDPRRPSCDMDGAKILIGERRRVTLTGGDEGGLTVKQPRLQAVALLGVPVEAGAGVAGCAMGPAMLRTAGIATMLKQLGQDVVDRGDLMLPHSLVHPRPPAGKARHFAEISTWARLLARETYAAMREGRLPVVLGGDHSLAMGSVSGVARYAAEAGRKLFVLWLDAHSDYNTPKTSPSGNMHGMPVAWLSGERGFGDLLGDEPGALVDPSRLHLFGIRSIDADERRLLQARGIDVVDMRRLDEDGFALSIRRIIDRVRVANGLLHVSLDVDFLDPTIAPGVGTAVPGGATYREAHLVMELLYESGLSPSLDLVELNPFLDERGKSALLLVDLTASLFGRQVY